MQMNNDYTAYQQLVAIQSVDINSMTASAVSTWGKTVTINLNIMIAGIMNIPDVGEQWIVQSVMGDFALFAKMPFQDKRITVQKRPGETWIGRGENPRKF